MAQVTAPILDSTSNIGTSRPAHFIEDVERLAETYGARLLGRTTRIMNGAPTHVPNMVWLYRRPILDYWSDHEAGGLDYGFEAAGFETRVAVEFDPTCCRNLRINRPWSIIEGDIHDVWQEKRSASRVLATLASPPATKALDPVLPAA
jgi:C-5 cytosine-specific DNA methylase